MFKFNLGQEVKETHFEQTHLIIGRAEYSDSENLYLCTAKDKPDIWYPEGRLKALIEV